MSNVKVVNVNVEDRSNEKNYYYCGGSARTNPLANPFTFNGKSNSRVKLSFKTREQAVNAYEEYFDSVYGKRGYEDITRAFDNIYKHYKLGEDIYLACTCAPNMCHCDIIAKKLQAKLVKEKLAERKAMLKNKDCLSSNQ